MVEDANGGTPQGRAWRERAGLPLPVAIGALVLLVGGIIGWWITASQASQASQAGGNAWQPATINNLVLEEGTEPITTGADYHAIDTRAEDPSPLTTAELTQVFPPGQGGGPTDVSSDCAGAVTGVLIIQALKAAGCNQVLRLIATSTGTGGPCTALIDIFNLAGGPSLIQAARAFGQEPGSGATNFYPSHPPDAAPDGFILPWHGISTADIARASGNAADVDAFGHFLVVIWTYRPARGSQGSLHAQLVNGLIEIALSSFADNRADDGATG